VAYGGAQALCGVSPDLTCLGKVIGGGLPAAAYGGPAEIMRGVAPAGTMYQAGTLSGNPLAMAAGIATLHELQRPGVYEALFSTAKRLAIGFEHEAKASGVPLRAAAVGSMWGFFFAESAVTDYATARRADTATFARFFHGMLSRGVYLAPSQFESAFVSTMHGREEVERTVHSAGETFGAMQR
jgi:glutamate-1-semialdehyde 2,1-aminomutase